jgi:hypothetical protein
LDEAALLLFGKPLHIAPAKLQAALDPAQNLVGRSLLGGPAPAAMAQMIARRTEALAQDRQSISAIGQRIAAARAACWAATGELVAARP